MTDLLDDLVRSVLNDPLGDDIAPGWTNVLEREAPAGTARLGPRRRPWVRVLVAACVALVVLVPPAVAFHRQLLDLIQGKPAPQSVVSEFKGWNALRASEHNRLIGMSLFVSLFLEVAPSKALGVVELRTAGGTVSLWEAPQRRGGECWIFVFGNPRPGSTYSNIGSCDTEPAPSGAITLVQWVGSHVLPNERIVHARVHGASLVEIRFADGTTQTMEVVAGHAVAAIPTDSHPVAVIAKDSAGTVIATVPLRFPPSRLMPCPGTCSGSSGGASGSSVVSNSFGQVTLHHK